MVVDAFLSPYFPETENLFDDSIVLMIDVLRASTTIAAALYNGAKEVIPCDTLDKAVKVYSSLSKDIRFLGGERNGIKPSGFDAGNSPLEFSPENVVGKSVILSTSNGTKTFLKAKLARKRLIAGFVNHNIIRDYLFSQIDESIKDNKELRIFILCSGTNGRLSYEDILCAGSYIQEMTTHFKFEKLSDSAEIAKTLFNLHRKSLKEVLIQSDHSKRLIDIGFADDIEIALTFNAYPVLPEFVGSSIKVLKLSE